MNIFNNYVLVKQGKDQMDGHGLYHLIIINETTSDIHLGLNNTYICLPYNNLNLKSESIKESFDVYGIRDTYLQYENGLYGREYCGGFTPFEDQNNFKQILHNFLISEFLI